MQFALGDMGMTSYEFHCLTAAEYILAVRGYDRKLIREWEHTRLIAYTSAKPKQDISSWMPLPTDNGAGVIEESKLMEAWAKATQKHGARTQDKD